MKLPVGYSLIKSQEVPEAESWAHEFRHEKTGAKLLYLENDDDNKVFAISFRTPPQDDTGVAHIVEHSVLCGSRKYPLKEPFVELAKGSLNTFLNAMTYPDKTVYPVASRNEQDFKNLMDVYLDAVFYPAMLGTPEILMQEGWHYEIGDAAAPLAYSGVVYNEMKGALSSPDDLLGSRIMRSLYPDSPYGFESGGDPKAIPTLTQEAFASFHAKYYHPSNSFIYFYGDMDIEERLTYLDKEYLSRFTALEIDSAVRWQPAFAVRRRLTEEYPIGTEEELTGKTFHSLNWVLGDVLDADTMLGMEILEHALLRAQAAPLRKALINANLGKDVDSHYEDDMRQPFFSVVLNGSEPDKADDFYKVVMAELKRLAAEGIEPTLLESSVNLLEFRLREADFGTSPKGLIYGIHALRSWLYDGDPTLFIRYENALARMKAGLNKGLFEELIDKLLINNCHSALLTLTPSRELAGREREILEKELAARKEQLSDEEIADIIAAAGALKERQQQPETPENLATIPLLKLSDIRKEAYPLPLEERDLAGCKILLSDIETHDIAYLHFYFPADRVAQEDLPYVYLLAELLGAVDTAEHSYAELGTLIDLHTGDIDAEVTVYSEKDNPDSFLPKFEVTVKVLLEKIPAAFKLLTEIFTSSRYNDPRRLKELLEQEEMSIVLSMQRSAHSIVASRLAAGCTKAGRYSDEGSLPFYRFVRDFLSDFDRSLDKLQTVFARIQPQIFQSQDLIVSVTMPKAAYDKFAVEFLSFHKTLAPGQFPVQEYKWDYKPIAEALLSSSPVQYVGKGANFLKLGFKFTGSLHVLETILRYDYFWNRIRVLGGAYGAFASFQRTGQFLFCSYRDPNLKETIAVYNDTAAFLKNFSVSEREMTKFIIGTMSSIDIPLTPKMKGRLAARCYLQGITLADRQKSRQEILESREEDIRKLADLVAAAMQIDCLCVFGNEKLLTDNSEIFSVMQTVVD